jgi:hypothetical protein
MAVRESGTETREEGSLSTEDGVAGEVRTAALSLGSYLATCRAAVIAVTLSVVAMFMPVATVPYGQIDDYSFLWLAISGHPDPQAGRSIFDAGAVQGVRSSDCSTPGSSRRRARSTISASSALSPS